MTYESSELIEDSSKEHVQSLKKEGGQSSANCDLMDEYDETHMENILLLWHNVDFKQTRIFQYGTCGIEFLEKRIMMDQVSKRKFQDTV
jgi:hypothetical protein